MKFDYYSLEAHPCVAAAAAAHAESLGYDGWFTGETNFNALVPAAVAAARTTRIDIGTAVAVAFARSPMELAYAANDLQAVTAGRFILGLGTQVAAHIQRRFSMPWSNPVARMREYVAALRLIWRSWETQERLDFRGDFYTHTVMPPLFAGKMHGYGSAPIGLAAVGPSMTALAGEMADVFLAAPLTTERYLREVSLPAIERGARAAGRSPDEVQVAATVFAVAGASEVEAAATREKVRARIAFYASTPAYQRVLDLHGWSELGVELQQLSRQRRFSEMAALVDDELLDAFVVMVEQPADIGAGIVARYGGLIDRVSLYPEFDLDSATRERLAAALQADLGRSGQQQVST